MLVVRVELHSAVTRKVTELARMDICNIGGTNTVGDYSCATYRGRSRDALDARITNRYGTVTKYPRLALHVWNLVAEALKALEYGRP